MQVEQDGFGARLLDDPQRPLAVGGGADHVDVGQQAEHRDQPFPDAGLVVSYDDPERLAGYLCSCHRGTVASTTQSLPRRLALSVPRSSSRRSRRPVSP